MKHFMATHDTSESSCDLSPQARAFSTVLTAFIGSIVNGLTSGGFIAFMTAWISWFAVQSHCADPLGRRELDSGFGIIEIGSRPWSLDLGNIAHHRHEKAVRIQLEEARYGGAFASALFKIVNGVSAFGMGIICVALLIKGAADLNLAWYFFVIYCVFMVIWTAASFAIWPVQDGGIKGSGIIPDVLMGAFAGLFLAAPAFDLMKSAEQPTLTSGGFSTPDSGQTSLKKYLACEDVAVWQKFVAIFP